MKYKRTPNTTSRHHNHLNQGLNTMVKTQLVRDVELVVLNVCLPHTHLDGAVEPGGHVLHEAVQRLHVRACLFVQGLCKLLLPFRRFPGERGLLQCSTKINTNTKKTINKQNGWKTEGKRRDNPDLMRAINTQAEQNAAL